MSEPRVQVPEELRKKIDEHVAVHGFRDVDAFVETAVRYYLERHSDDAWRTYVEKEVAWSRRNAD